MFISILSLPEHTAEHVYENLHKFSAVYCPKLNSKWEKCNRIKKYFIKKHEILLESPLAFPRFGENNNYEYNHISSRERPQKLLGSCSTRAR